MMKTELSQPPVPRDRAREPHGAMDAPATSPSPNGTAGAESIAAPPEWFTRRKAAAAAESNSPASRSAVRIRPVEEPELTLYQKVFRWLVGTAAVGYVTSFLVHFVALLILSAVVYSEIHERGLSILMTQAEGLDTEIEQIELQIESAGGSDAELETPQMRPVDIPQQEMAEPELPTQLLADATKPPVAGDGDDGQGEGSGTGEGAGDGDGSGVILPRGGKAVSKGSFTAWTIPEDPAPGQRYLIVIQIEVPEDILRFPRRDLLGSVVIGTDGYRQLIPETTRGFLPLKERRAQMVIPVPGARELVKDTIQLQSKLLKEKQTLQIVF